MTKASSVVIIGMSDETPVRFLELGFGAGDHLEISHQNILLNVLMIRHRNTKYYMNITDFNKYFTIKED